MLNKCEETIINNGFDKIVLGVGFDYLMPGVPTSKKYTESVHEKSKGRPWYNKWLKYAGKLNLTEEEIKFLEVLYTYKQVNQSNELEENNKLSKRR